MNGVGTDMPDLTGLALAYGTYEDARAMVGAATAPFHGDVAVNVPMIQYYCALTEDGNLSYWDIDAAEASWGAIISPPGMIPVWTIPLPWRPSGARKLPLMLAAVPLPGDTLINASTDSEFLAPVLVGDRLSVIDEVVDVSPEKTTQRGVGHFISTRMTYRNQRDEVVAVYRNVMFRFTAPGPETSDTVRPAAVPPAHGAGEGSAVSTVDFAATYAKVVLNAASTWDYFPGHHDPDYARLQGQPTIYMSTLFFQGFVDRVVTDWAGPGAFICRRSMRMVGSICAGASVRGEGTVTRRQENASGSTVDLRVTVSADDIPCCLATVTVRLGRQAIGPVS